MDLLTTNLMFMATDPNVVTDVIDLYAYGDLTGVTVFRRSVYRNGIMYVVGHTTSGVGCSSTCAFVGKLDINAKTMIGKLFNGYSVDEFYDIAISADDQLYVVGKTASAGPGADERCLIYKLDSNLNVINSNILGGTRADRLFGVTILPDGSIIAVGSSRSDANSQQQRCYLIKYNSDLTVISRRVFGGNRNDELLAVTNDNAGNIYCAGYTASSGPGARDRMFVCKISPALSITNSLIIGGSDYDRFTDIVLDNSGDVICIGYTESTGPSTGTNAVIVKLDASLNYINGRAIGAVDSNTSFSGVVIDDIGDIICVGYTSADRSSTEGLICKFGPDLGLILKKKILGGSNEDIFYDVDVDDCGCLFIAGNSASFSFDSSGFIVITPNELPDTNVRGIINPSIEYTDSTITSVNLSLGYTVSSYTAILSTLNNSTSTLAVSDSTLTLIIDSMS